MKQTNTNKFRKTLGIVIASIVSLSILSGCSTYRQWVDPGNIGVVVKWSELDETGQPKFQVFEAGQYMYANMWSDSYGTFSNATQTSSFKSADYNVPIPGFEPGVNCADKGDNKVTLNITARWETNRATIGRLVMEFKDVPLRGATGDDPNDLENKLLKRDMEVVVNRVCRKYDGITMRNSIDIMGSDIYTGLKPLLAKNGLSLLTLDVAAINLDDKQDAQLRADVDRQTAADQALFDQQQKIKSLDTAAKVSAGQAEIDAEYIRKIREAWGGDNNAAALYILSRQDHITSVQVVNWANAQVAASGTVTETK